MRKTKQTPSEINRNIEARKRNPEFYIESKIDSKIYCKKNGAFSRHLREHGLDYRTYWESYETGVTPLCRCMKPLSFSQIDNSYAGSCGKPICVGLNVSKAKQSISPEENHLINEKRKKTCKKKFGTEFPIQSAEISNKVKTTRREIMSDGRTREAHIQEAARRGKLEKHGDENYNNSKKISKTKQEFTVEKNNEINEKRRKTCMEKYGVENVLMLAKSKVGASNGRLKEYTLPSGNIIKVQGYEPKALDKLFSIYSESEVMISKADNMSKCGMPIISWQDVARHNHNYYPDIYIPGENKIIEVKSRWWFDGNGAEKYHSRLINNMRKQQSAVSAGYQHVFWIFEKNGNISYV